MLLPLALNRLLSSVQRLVTLCTLEAQENFQILWRRCVYHMLT